MFKLFVTILVTMILLASPSAARGGLGQSLIDKIQGGDFDISSSLPSWFQCNSYKNETACDAPDNDCVWCMKNVTEGKGICKPDSSVIDGARFQGGCCAVAQTDESCFENDGKSGEECVWWSMSTTVTASNKNDADIVEPMDRSRSYCSKLYCKMIEIQDDCTEERGCEWTGDKCDRI